MNKPFWWNDSNSNEKYRFKKTGMEPLRFQVRQCCFCGLEFSPRSSKAKTCGKECARKNEVKQQNRRSAEWAKANPEKVKKASVRYALNRIKHSPIARLVHYSRNLIRDSLKRQSVSKNTRSHELLGISGKQFMEHLLNHECSNADFTAENYGSVWSVDHIKPLAAFDLADMAEQKKAFHFTNCQPMRMDENRSKNSFYNGKRYYHTAGAS